MERGAHRMRRAWNEAIQRLKHPISNTPYPIAMVDALSQRMRGKAAGMAQVNPLNVGGLTSGPDRRPLDGKCDGPVPYVSQAPQAVRSAGGRR